MKNKGITLVEVIVAVAIFLIGVLPLMKMIRDGLRGITTSGLNSKASNLGQEIIEQIKNKKWDENCIIYGSTVTATGGVGAGFASTVLGPDTGETASSTNLTSIPLNWNDIDDFNGSTIKRQLGNKGIEFDVNVTVNYVTLPDTGGDITYSPGGARTNYKLIVASVTWKNIDNIPGGPVILKTIKSNYNKY